MRCSTEPRSCSRLNSTATRVNWGSRRSRRGLGRRVSPGTTARARVVDACVMHATGTAEREAATGLLAALPPGGATVGADPPTPGSSRRVKGDYAARRAEGTRRDRPAHDAAPRLRREPTSPQTRRRDLRLDDDQRWPAQAAASRRGARRVAVSLRRCGLQPGPAAHAAGGGRVRTPPTRRRLRRGPHRSNSRAC